MYYNNDMANVLGIDKKIAIIGSLAEGSSIRSIERLTGVHRDTIMRLGVRVGKGRIATMDAKMRMTRVEELRDVIRKLHGVESRHLESVSVKETFQGKTVWEGVVEVFELIGHPTTNGLYAWSHRTDDPGNPRRHVTVLHSHPITSPLMAVRAAIVQEFNGMPQPKPKKVGRPKLPKGDVKGRVVPVRFNPDELKRIVGAARASDRTLSEWIRSTLKAATQR